MPLALPPPLPLPTYTRTEPRQVCTQETSSKTRETATQGGEGGGRAPAEPCCPEGHDIATACTKCNVKWPLLHPSSLSSACKGRYNQQTDKSEHATGEEGGKKNGCTSFIADRKQVKLKAAGHSIEANTEILQTEHAWYIRNPRSVDFSVSHEKAPPGQLPRDPCETHSLHTLLLQWL